MIVFIISFLLFFSSCQIKANQNKEEPLKSLSMNKVFWKGYSPIKDFILFSLHLYISLS